VPKTPIASRAELARAPLLVVKVGTSSLTDSAGHLDAGRLDALVAALAGHIQSGRRLVLVSSGAQAAGMPALGLSRKPANLAQAQAAASAGQGLLMAHYTRAFARSGLVAAQILLTAEDVVRRSHYRNALRVFEELLRRDIVPVVNENDAVATDEIRFGDNDRLAALVAHLVRADALVLLTDVDGLYTASPAVPGARRVGEVRAFAELERYHVTSRGSAVGTGGMVAKIHAAAMASSSGIPVLLASAGQVREALRGEDVGTFFHATGRRVPARQLWLGYAAQMRGRLVVDAGAAGAITKGKKSLLPAGVVKVAGSFGAGEPVEIADETGAVLARGLAGYPAADLDAVKGKTLDAIGELLGAERAVPAVHRDELVVQAADRRPT
jgi:glutamate 5-kinase